MKDSRDHDTVDMAAFERSFQKYPNIRVHRDGTKVVTGFTVAQIQRYLREKPYLQEALRRPVK